MQVLKGRRHRIEGVAFSPCGRWLAACGVYGGVHVWDTSNPTKKPQHPALAENYTDYIYANSMAFRADGNLFLSTYQRRWYLYDPVADKLTPAGTNQEREVVAAPDGARVVRVNTRSPLVIKAFGKRGKPSTESSVTATDRYFGTVAFAPDCATFVTAERGTGTAHGDGPWLTIRTAATAKPVRELVAVFTNPEQMAFMPSGAHLIARSAGSLACWTIAEPDKAPQKGINPSRRHFLSMAVHPAGHVLTVDNDRLVRVWDVPSLATDRTIEWNIGKLYAVAVSPDGTRAAVGSHTGKVLVWDWD